MRTKITSRASVPQANSTPTKARFENVYFKTGSSRVGHRMKPPRLEDDADMLGVVTNLSLAFGTTFLNVTQTQL